jgi:sugar/nucleoside kinase (ribokinase family)
MEDLAPLCPLLDCLFLNQQEAQMLTGSGDPAAAGRFFHDRGVPLVVVKLGADGCAVSTPGALSRVPGFPVNPVDTTGAGDCFCGGFLVALCRGLSVSDAARFGNAVAAHCVRQVGGTEGVVGFEETLEWMASHNYGKVGE